MQNNIHLIPNKIKPYVLVAARLILETDSKHPHWDN